MKSEMSDFDAIFCDHTRIAPCCDPVDCLHYSCPCGLYCDDGQAFADEQWEEMLREDFGPAEAA